MAGCGGHLGYCLVFGRTLMARMDGDNHYTEGSLLMDYWGSELKELETLAKSHTAWRNKVETLVT